MPTNLDLLLKRYEGKPAADCGTLSLALVGSAYGSCCIRSSDNRNVPKSQTPKKSVNSNKTGGIAFQFKVSLILITINIFQDL